MIRRVQNVLFSYDTSLYIMEHMWQSNTTKPRSDLIVNTGLFMRRSISK